MHNLCLASCIDSYTVRHTLPTSRCTTTSQQTNYLPNLGLGALIPDSRSRTRPLPEANISDELSGNCFFRFTTTLALTPNLYGSSFDVSSALIAIKGTLASNLGNDSYVFYSWYVTFCFNIPIPRR